MRHIRKPAFAAALACAALAGCANNSPLETGSVTSPALAKASADPACTTLAAQIDGLRKDGATDRLEKAATGTGSTVNVQRAALNKQAQLNKANADFIAKCGPSLPKSQVASAVAAKGVAAAAPAAAAKASPVVQQGVTVAAPAAVPPVAVPPAAAAAATATDVAKAAVPKQ